jgi:rare lipoprotein A
MRFKLLCLLLVAIAAASMGCHRTVRGEPARGSYIEEGTASYYGAEFQGRRTANGERFNPEEFTAAHRTLRFGTCLVVQNLRNGAHVQVRINDRGPYAANRILDVSQAAARKLGMIVAGWAPVRLYRCDSS